MMLSLAKLPSGLQQTLVYATALALAKAFSLLMVPVATRYLTPADYGRLDILQTLADLLGIVIGMGLAETLFRFAGTTDKTTKQRDVAANVLGLALVLAGLTLVVSQYFASTLVQWLPGDISLVQCRIILLTLALSNLVLVPLAWLRLQGMCWHYLVGAVGQVGLQACLGAALLMLGMGIDGVLWGGLIATSLASAWLLKTQWQATGIKFNLLRFKAFSGYGGPLIFVGIAGFVLGSFDRWLLAQSVGVAEMALYALAAKFGLMTAVLIQPFDLWWHARRFSVLQEVNGPTKCARWAEAGISLAMVSALCIAAAGPWLVALLTPSTYHGAIVFIPWLTGLAAIHNINASLGFGTMSQQNTRWPAIIDGSAAALALIGYLLLIPLWGSWGAIIATAIALVSRCLATLIISQRVLNLPYRLGRLSLLALLTCLGLTLMPLDTQFSSLLQALVLVTALIGCGFKLGLVPLRSTAYEQD